VPYCQQSPGLMISSHGTNTVSENCKSIHHFSGHIIRVKCTSGPQTCELIIFALFRSGTAIKWIGFSKVSKQF
jgi:hypothetical protein